MKNKLRLHLQLIDIKDALFLAGEEELAKRLNKTIMELEE